jgi:predicted TIM-barrel fold metal-dependent hydrolase
MKIIALEEHYTTPAYSAMTEATRRRAVSLADRSKKLGHDIEAELLDLGTSRIAAMDAAGVDLQVLSMTIPGLQGFSDAAKAIPFATETNDHVAAAVKRHPTRLAGFAVLPTIDPTASVKELERCVTKLGFKGTMINGHTQGSFLDEPKYLPIFEAAAALKVPVYIHPRDPHPLAIQAYFQGYDELVTAAWGFAMDTCSHFLRLMMAGVFDRFENLKIILGHLGEGLPFWLPRLNDHTEIGMKRRGLKRNATQYITQNLAVTCSGHFSTPAFLCTVLTLGIDNVMFSIDWPYESNKLGMAFLKNLPFSPADLEKIAHANAERILRL